MEFLAMQQPSTTRTVTQADMNIMRVVFGLTRESRSMTTRLLSSRDMPTFRATWFRTISTKSPRLG